MANEYPPAGSTVARLREVTGHRLTVEESLIINALLEMARKPFDVGRPSGDDPATLFLPIVLEPEGPTL